MKVDESGQFHVDKPPAKVVELLTKPEVVARLIPGVSKVEKAGDEYVGEAVVKLGHLSGKMATRFKYAEVRDDGVVITGRATGLQTTADFKIEVAVKPSGGGSLVDWRFQGEARGLAATLAPSVVKGALRKMAEEAAQNLAQYINSLQ
ncbi:CoxG family protein [Pyrobaculum aerophilum]|uniref:Carbon monoxide dehydrogenase n=1 Tax=Pyrobaculum aerophilum TaxID=13773 RepID=A0A371R4F6_9CREN|nr:CoxG family protein [Pyrobaculum aerophilum]RFA93175.1 carbon monoxide dehydrogenase [Pyrobaculum aerophilum]RFA98972.1 carbon monoxide dehydrogenase [Pyrobaculum aerophilum]